MRIISNNENWQEVFKNAKRGFLALRSNGKIILDPRNKTLDNPVIYYLAVRRDIAATSLTGMLWDKSNSSPQA
jgi:hypothetical protein